MFILVGWLHVSGKFSDWYYYQAEEDGYVINADTFAQASAETPALLEIGQFSSLDGLKAVKVKKGDLLPRLANGIITDKILKKGKRAVLEGNRIKVMIPWEIQESKGFKFKDTFKHKGIKTYPWAAVVNVALVVFLGISLGYMAEGFTDVLGIKLEKIQHFSH
jgi:hypothetical protein